eukprot:CAMPEP_0184518662 /NCGR_PEP_ID=MMETSP0198_2-20121128/6201_1 /TAXON_ID=1112570 /ORGANISM="Thraustochytrium sp., Strain LLF1b" /LENGTH=107 /DNA_ID=CAMNT_0026909103 /DNA_START=60 /DNA_END=383 /DNA_ORIENTATION=+
MELSTVLVSLGFALLIHAAFSAAHYKELAAVAGLELESNFVPFDVKVETLIGVAVSVCGAVFGVSNMSPIDGSAKLNKVTWESFWDEKNFRIYNHRAKALKERLKQK